MRRVALDTNILAYLAGVSRIPGDDAKIARTRVLVEQLSANCTLIAPIQTLGELFIVLRRAGATAEDARSVLIEFADSLGASSSTRGSMLAAADLVVDHRLQFWDALIVSAAVEAGCTLLLSEDMQHGFIVRGLTVINPLAAELHPKLGALVSD